MTDYIECAERDAAEIMLKADGYHDKRLAAHMIEALILAAIARNGGEMNLAYAQRIRKACKRLALH